MTSRRVQLIFYSMVGLISIAGVVLLSTGTFASESNVPEFDVRTIDRADGSEGVSISGTRRMDAPLEGVDESQTISNLADLIALHGEPEAADYGRMRIPSIGVDAPLALFVVDGGTMPDPLGPVDVAFYDMRHWDGLGGYPGGGENAIFGGHVDLNRHLEYADGAHFRGPAVFWHLDQLVPGDVIEVEAGGQVLRYAVVWNEDFTTEGTDWRSIWSSDVPVDSITLFTCGGEFDFTTHEYSHRVVVRAERI